MSPPSSPGAAPPAGRPRAAALGVAALACAVGLGRTARGAEKAAGDAAGCTVALVPARAVLTLGVDTETRVDVTVSGCDPSGLVPGHVQATVGVLDPLSAGAVPGTFSAIYHAPEERFPQAALLAIELSLPDGARLHAATVISLPAMTTFPFHTEPRASVTLEVAGRTFGPVTAAEDGTVQIPIVVPPGAEKGLAVAKGRYGGLNQMDVNLQGRDYPRVLLVAPDAAEAGAALQVAAWAVEPTGVPAIPEDIDLKTSLGFVRRTGGAPGVARFVVTLPRDAAEGEARLTASMNDGSSARTKTVSLRPGPAALLVVTSNRPQLVVGSGEVATIEISARDRWGNDTSVAGVTATVDDLPLLVEGDDDGVTGHLPAPAIWTGREKAVIDARLGKAETRKELLITGAEPSNVRVTASRTRLAADGHASVDLIAEVSDRRGTPTTTSRIIWTTTDDGLLVTTPSPRFGAYAARFTPNPALHDRRAVIDTVVDPDLHAQQVIVVDTAPARMATARVGLISNLGGLFGQTAFLEASLPYPSRGRLLRLFSVGLSLGYIHGEVNIDANQATGVPALQAEMNQFPVLANLRMHIPVPWPIEASATALAGFTWLTSSITDLSTGLGLSSGSAGGLVLGLGGDLAFPLRPGEFVVGVRYLAVSVQRLSNGDHLSGNAGGLVGDLGFRLRL